MAAHVLFVANAALVWLTMRPLASTAECASTECEAGTDRARRGAAMVQRARKTVPSTMLQRHDMKPKQLDDLAHVSKPRQLDAKQWAEEAHAILSGRDEDDLAPATRPNQEDNLAPSTATKPKLLDGANRYNRTMSSSKRTALFAHAVQLRKQAEADQRMLQKSLDALGGPSGASNEIDKLILEFESEQGTSADRCPAKLLEAKHQLNELHKHMYSIAWEINTTQTQVRIVTKHIEKIEAEWAEGTEQCNIEKNKCNDQTAEYTKQWEILIWELIEMKQIANPQVAITEADMSYAAWQSAVAHNWTNMAESSSTTHDSWSDVVEGMGNGSVPLYDGSGEKPDWWPTLVQLPDNATTAEEAQPQALPALVSSAKQKAKELNECLEFFADDAHAMNISAMTSQLAQNGKTTLGQIGTGSGSGDGSSSTESSSEFEEIINMESSSSSESSSHFANVTNEECKAQLIAFEVTYYRAYRQVTRLVSEYEILMNSTSCIDAVMEECAAGEAEWILNVEKLTEKLEELSHKMLSTKGHITTMSKSEKSFQAYIVKLSETCATLDETISDLDKVRDAIQIFDVCAGLGRPNFHIPVYTNRTITNEFDSAKVSTDAADKEFNSWCDHIIVDGLVARAAETSEIMQQSVKGMPAKNPSSAPLFGTCPHCAGIIDETGESVTGFWRNCWDGKATLGGATMRSDCGHNSEKAVMCVVDRYDGLNDGTDGTDSASSL